MPAAMPDIHVTGAIHHWIQTRDIQVPWYLGTAEITPQIQLRQYYTDKIVPVAGGTLPYQRTYDGEAATVSVLLTRWSKTTELYLREAGTAAKVMDGPGEGTRWSRGSLAYGSKDMQLWQIFEFGRTGAETVASPNLEIGWYWPAVTLDLFSIVSAGTQAERALVVFDCHAKYHTAATLRTPTGSERGWTLYSHAADKFPDSVKVPQ